MALEVPGEMPDVDDRSERTLGKAVLCGLVGRGIGLSRTPRLHETEGARLGLRSVYRLFDMDDPRMDGRSLDEVVRAAELCGFAGLNVTYPYKIEALGLLDALSDNARLVGAVNTIVFRDGRRLGHNTDLWGFAEGFRRGLRDVALDRALLIGAGGAGVAVGMALMQLGIGHLAIHDQAPARAEALAETLTGIFGPGRASATAAPMDAGPVDGLVNATPVGMAKLPGMAAPSELLRPGMWVADIVYFPLETELLARARAAGCQVLSGEGMAVFQAVRAFRLFTGLEPDSARMAETFRRMGA